MRSERDSLSKYIFRYSQNKTHTHKYRIIFKPNFLYNVSVTLHASFCVELNCDCFLYLERMWLLNLKPFILGILVVSGGIKLERRKKWESGRRALPSRMWTFCHCLLSRGLPGARLKGFSYGDSPIIFTSLWPIYLNKSLTNCTQEMCLPCFVLFSFNKWHGTSQ